MPIPFRIKQRGDLRWVPEAPELADVAYFSDDGVSPPDAIRESLFVAVNNLYPGVYTLELDLVSERDLAFRRIDQRSDELIEAGFPFEGSVFSLSVEAQVRFSTMLMLADALPYPLTINSLDDRSAVDLLNGDHTRAFCMSALGHVKGVVDSGSVQKGLVRDMTDAQAISDYQDPR